MKYIVLSLLLGACGMKHTIDTEPQEVIVKFDFEGMTNFCQEFTTESSQQKCLESLIILIEQAAKAR